MRVGFFVVLGTHPHADHISQIDGCVNINVAEREELVEIVHIGEGRVVQLRGHRPYKKMDELTKINGISNKMKELRQRKRSLYKRK
ncbi:hypothetical protein [Alkalihalobacillus sp. BA299]|uniref:hypothetical protein n=1 Tax=Alkalihalobacillus sp. BA299 TaxID=2815938 RepID=UPI001ADD3E59|nr:hypothetical protein [Alkalihalobacillus sp. BA299]